MSESHGRLIPLDAGQPAENMAIDQALLESVGAGGAPVLRLYRWTQPTLSLGYFQKSGDRDQHAESASVTCVRRATGGGAILHHHELTYSIALPLAPRQTGPRLELYAQTHQAFREALARFGIRAASWADLNGDTRRSAPAKTSPFLCFQRRTPEDLIVSGYKVLGSAQRKTRSAVLQHGSLLLRVSRHAPQLPGLCDLSSRRIIAEEFAGVLVSRLAEAWSIAWWPGEVTASEMSRAEQIRIERFAHPDWLMRR